MYARYLQARFSTGRAWSTAWVTRFIRSQSLCVKDCDRKGARRRICPLQPRRQSRVGAYHGGEKSFTPRNAQRGFLFRLRLFDAKPSRSAVYADIRHSAYYRLERAPYGGACVRRKDNPPRVRVRPTEKKLYNFKTKITLKPSPQGRLFYF